MYGMTALQMDKISSNKNNSITVIRSTFLTESVWNTLPTEEVDIYSKKPLSIQLQIQIKSLTGV